MEGAIGGRVCTDCARSGGVREREWHRHWAALWEACEEHGNESAGAEGGGFSGDSIRDSKGRTFWEPHLVSAVTYPLSRIDMRRSISRLHFASSASSAWLWPSWLGLLLVTPSSWDCP